MNEWLVWFGFVLFIHFMLYKLYYYKNNIKMKMIHAMVYDQQYFQKPEVTCQQEP